MKNVSNEVPSMPPFNQAPLIERSLKLRFNSDCSEESINSQIEKWNDLLSEMLDMIGTDGNMLFCKRYRQVELLENDSFCFVYAVRADKAGWEAFMSCTSFPIPDNNEFGLVSRDSGNVQNIVMSEHQRPELRVVQ